MHTNFHKTKNNMPIDVDDDTSAAHIPNGFLVLDHCDIYFSRDECESDTYDANIATPLVNTDPWFDIEIPSPQNHLDSNLPLDVAEKTSSSTTIKCPNCCLVLTSKPHSSFHKTKQWKVKGHSKERNGPRYDGTIRETKCQLCSNGKQRSDAALMLGLSLLSQDLGHIVIQSIKVGLYSDRTSSVMATDNANKSSLNGTRKGKACLLITFWCREILNNSLDSPHHERRQFFQHATDKRLLHPATQSIMSIMSSDWKEYDAKIAELSSLSSSIEKVTHSKTMGVAHGMNASNDNDRMNKNDANRQTRLNPPVSFFPSKMNLEDVFLRISGVSSASMISNPEFDSGRRNGANCRLVMLPRDVLCHNIGQYLRAKSLDSLRCTCKQLHWALKAVVPGLKLRLYSHQIKSLMWMRGREARQITEDNLCYNDNRNCRHHLSRQRRHDQEIQTMTDWIKDTPDGDAHRAATGGGTVALCPRRTRGTEDSFDVTPVRISQLDHSEIVRKRRNYNEAGNGMRSRIVEDPLARKVARGGLLCDDPGLGTYGIRSL